MARFTTSEVWEDLQKQASHLENELDAKFEAFSKLAVNTGLMQTSIETRPLLDEDNVFENMSSEIESLLQKLALLNEKMNKIKVGTIVRRLAINRHNDILKIYNLEFKKITGNFTTRKNREELLNEHSNDKRYKNTSRLSQRDLYVKENQHIHNSDRLINDQINIAMEARDNLMAQRYTFKRMQSRINYLSNRFPAINSLVQRISLRKRRDSIIIGLIVGICVFLILFYTFH